MKILTTLGLTVAILTLGCSGGSAVATPSPPLATASSTPSAATRCDARGEGVDLHDCRLVFLFGASLNGANLDGASLNGCTCDGAKLWDASLIGADLSYAGLTSANFTNADLSLANLSGANLSGANFTNANLSGANLTNANLEGATFSRANLLGATTSDIYIQDSGANFTGTTMPDGTVHE